MAYRWSFRVWLSYAHDTWSNVLLKDEKDKIFILYFYLQYIYSVVFFLLRTVIPILYDFCLRPDTLVASRSLINCRLADFTHHNKLWKTISVLSEYASQICNFISSDGISKLAFLPIRRRNSSLVTFWVELTIHSLDICGPCNLC